MSKMSKHVSKKSLEDEFVKKLEKIEKRMTPEQKEKKNVKKYENERTERKKKSEKKDPVSGYKPARRQGISQGTEGGAKRRSKVDCPVYHRCGGCSLRHISYEQQLKRKQENVSKLVGHFGKVSPIIGMVYPYYYRNKVHATFGRLRNGTYISGVYEEGTHRIVPIETCLIEDQKADAIINTIRGFLKSFKITTYDEDTGYGLLRHVMVRTGHRSGQVMVVLVLTSPILPSKNNFVKALRKEHPEITTIILNVNDKQTSMVLGEKQTVLYGKGYIEDELCGCTFRISPKSFYQVNPIQTEILYSKAIELAGLTGKETVIDAYCGIGTIGLIASKHAKEVIGVELNSDAIKDAITNAKQNEIKNVIFYNKDAGEFMVEQAQKEKKIDVVFMDPPRAGSDEAFLSSVVKLAPEKIIYISCNPETLADDLEYLVARKYKVEEIVPVDMFAWTGHVETVVMMSRKETLKRKV